MPPLREHLTDIPALAGHFADRVRKHIGCGPIRYEPTAFCALEASDWPGNVRELENVVSRAILRASARAKHGEMVLVREADLDVRPSAPREASRANAATPSAAVPTESPGRAAAHAALAEGATLRTALERFERELIAVAIESAEGNLAGAARALDVDRSNLHRIAKRLGLK